MNFSASAPARQPVPEVPEHQLPVAPEPEETPQTNGNSVAHLRLLWEHRRLLTRVALCALLASTLIAFLIPARYDSTARLMPPDNQSTSGLAAAAAAMARAYVEELNRLVAELSTSSARRERLFLEERLKAVNQDLEAAEKEFSQFSSKNTAIDIKEQGKAMVEAAATLQGQYIAAQSELEGLKQIYTDNNVRVRSVRARIGELKRQLEKLGGKGEQASEPSGQQTDYLYPSIRKLPLLGVTYADLYRRTRVQEAVFEALTKEYEMAKVQEAKEIPTVKVLDAPNIPEKKSFPPRLLIILLGTASAIALGAVWVIGKSRWEATDPTNPRKVFAKEVFQASKAYLPWASKNGWKQHSGTDEDLGEAVPREDAEKSAESRSK